MSEMRVYEAATKLNMSVGEVIGLLAEKGVDVKSPIAVITQAQFDEILDSFTREPVPASSKTPEPEAPAAEAPVEKERSRLASVTPITAAKQIQEPQPAHESDEDEDAPAEPAGKTQPVPPVREPMAEVKPARGADFTHKIAYTAAGLSIFALLGTIVLAVAAFRNASEVGALGSTVASNQSAINDTRNSVSDLKSRLLQSQRLQIRTGLSERSVTLDEMAATMPGPNGERLRKLAESLNSLTSGM
ncbi:MAG: translation initiation factor IF-2 N-terminal domain-containing protein [Nitrospinae bacterium]|nr:translation initiation factor IF-2 N-terminal domain-containing protein [Nitrospinota bacterium]